jgi:hypothetical protein
MADALLYPLNIINPGQLLSEYSDWVYFTLLLVFFVSVSGITLRRHFDKPYVKPLIISVGLILTVTAFMARKTLSLVFDGWGLLGTVLLVFMAGTIPYGLCRGFGVPSSRAFHITYILFYILAWLKFPVLFYSLADHNLGLVSLGLFVLFIYSMFKMVKLKKSPSDMAKDLDKALPFRPRIDQEIATQKREKSQIKEQAGGFTRAEIRSIDDIAERLAEIQLIIETHQNNLPSEERQGITQTLRAISEKEGLFRAASVKLEKTFRQIGGADTELLQELKERMGRAKGDERQVLKKEIDVQEEKIRIEKSIIDFQTKLEQFIESFNRYLGSAVNAISQSAYPLDSKPHLSEARLVLKDISNLLAEMKALEGRLVELADSEKALLKKERKTA